MVVQTYILRDETVRTFALKAVRMAALGMQVRISKPGRSGDQNRRCWSMIQAIADAKVVIGDRAWEPEDYYEILASAYLRQKGLETGRLVQGLEGEMLTLGRIRPSQFTTEQFGEFMEVIAHFMAKNNVPWDETK